jgi:hypothetical protein
MDLRDRECVEIDETQLVQDTGLQAYYLAFVNSIMNPRILYKRQFFG